MAEAGYSMEEIKEIFQALYAEKKRVLELEDYSKQVEQNLARLKQMLNAAQKKEEEIVDRTLFEEMQKEKERLEEDLIESSCTIGSLQHDLRQLKQEFSLEKDEEISLLQKQILKLRDKSQEMELVLEESRLHAQQLEKGIEYLRAKLAESKTDRALLQERLNETSQQILQAEQESCKGKEDAESFLIKYQEAIQELNAVRSQCDTLKTSANASKKGYEEVSAQLTFSASKIKQLEEELETIRQQQFPLQRWEEAKKIYEQDKKALLDAHKEEMEGLSRARRHLEEEISRHLIEKEELTRQLEDKEKFKGRVIEFEARLHDSDTQMKLAQQHLAKKLKELSSVQEDLEKEKMAKIDAERKLNTFRLQVKELEENIELSRRREQEWKDQKRTQEAQQHQVEAKILEMKDKINTQQQRISQLESIEKKYAQLSQFFQGSQMSPTPEPEKPQLPPQEVETKPQEIAPVEIPKMESPPPPQNYNYHFFDHE